MIDIVRKNGDKINISQLSKELGCEVCEISALKGVGVKEAAERAVAAAESRECTVPQHSFCGCVEHAIAHIEEAFLHNIPEEQQRWYAIKIFERDEKVLSRLSIPKEIMEHIESDIAAAEREMDDDSESIITNERYIYIASIIKGCCKKKNKGGLTLSDKIDKVVTNRFLALPIFAVVMFIVYYVSVTTVGDWVTGWTNDTLFSDWITNGANKLLESINCAAWLQGLIVDGIIAGVGAVLGFVPQMLVLFIFLGFLEACGYMARIAFVMDRIFRKFGLSGKSFIPMLIGTGCGVPGVMASRTIENERDRRMTIMTTTFIPCGAKLPIIGLIAGALFNNAGWVSASAYFIGVGAIIVSGIMLKKTKLFSGDPAPFVMELPAYHLPTVGNVLRSMWGKRLVVYKESRYHNSFCRQLFFGFFRRLAGKTVLEWSTIWIILSLQKSETRLRGYSLRLAGATGNPPSRLLPDLLQRKTLLQRSDNYFTLQGRSFLKTETRYGRRSPLRLHGFQHILSLFSIFCARRALRQWERSSVK